jgi:hypothetical protein
MIMREEECCINDVMIRPGDTVYYLGTSMGYTRGRFAKYIGWVPMKNDEWAPVVAFDDFKYIINSLGDYERVPCVKRAILPKKRVIVVEHFQRAFK